MARVIVGQRHIHLDFTYVFKNTITNIPMVTSFNNSYLFITFWHEECHHNIVGYRKQRLLSFSTNGSIHVDCHDIVIKMRGLCFFIAQEMRSGGLFLCNAPVGVLLGRVHIWSQKRADYSGSAILNSLEAKGLRWTCPITSVTKGENVGAP